MNFRPDNKLLAEIAKLQNLLAKEIEKNRQLALKIKLLRSSKAFRAAHHIRLARQDWRYAIKLPRMVLRSVWRSLQKETIVPSYLNTPQKPKQLKAFDSRDLAAVRSWLDKHPEAASAEVIIYADINLNAVDGSSIWMANVASMIGSVARCIVITKAPVLRDIITGNIKNSENVVILNHQDIFQSDELLSSKNAIRLVRMLDDILPNLRRVIVRGLDSACELLSTRQFYNRSAVYITLTNYYKGDGGGLSIDSKSMDKLTLCFNQSAYLLTQTTFLDQQLRQVAGKDLQSIHLPPAIPDDLPFITFKNHYLAPSTPIKIGYAGKIDSEWGVLELLDWADSLKKEGISIELHIVADSIRNGPDPSHSNLRQTIKPRLAAAGVTHYTGKNRAESMEIMAAMDFVWCYRPSKLEDNTLEQSTKLTEMVAMGARCICYPNAINKELLGKRYPLFARDINGLRKILFEPVWAVPSAKVIERVRDGHSLKHISNRFCQSLLPELATRHTENVLFAGNDFKFIDAYISDLKSRGLNVCRDQWEWGEPSDLKRSERQMQEADIVFCEWALANAVWYSDNLPAEKKLFVRLHAQEVRERARRFPKLVKLDRVNKMIFIADHIREKAVQLNNWPLSSTELIPNYLFDDEFVLPNKVTNDKIHLAMLGIVPQLKRFDRAISLLRHLVATGNDAYLHIKGQRPENIPFMNVPGRAAEMTWYNHIYETIDTDPHLAGRVIFEPFGNDVAQWLQKMDVILSCSDSEGSHQALAEGVLSGCFPVLWPWEGGDKVYKPEWVIQDEYGAAARILEHCKLSDRKKAALATQNREYIVERYGREAVFAQLDNLLFGSNSS